jgi:hypothetical protein
MGPSTALKARSVTAFPLRAELNIHLRKAGIIYTSPTHAPGVSAFRLRAPDFSATAVLSIQWSHGGLPESIVAASGDRSRDAYRNPYVALSIAVFDIPCLFDPCLCTDTCFSQLTVP